MNVVKHASRTLAKTPFLTGVAVFSLALGIGANAAIFPVFDQMLLKLLPVHEPERLVNLAAPGPKYGSTSCGSAGNCEAVFSYPMFRYLQAAETDLGGIAAHLRFWGPTSHRPRAQREGSQRPTSPCWVFSRPWGACLVRPTMSLYDFGERQLGLDPNLPVENMKTLEAQMNEDIFEDRLFSTLAAAFAAAHLPASRASKVDPIHALKYE